MQMHDVDHDEPSCCEHYSFHCWWKRSYWRRWDGEYPCSKWLPTLCRRPKREEMSYCEWMHHEETSIVSCQNMFLESLTEKPLRLWTATTASLKRLNVTKPYPFVARLPSSVWNCMRALRNLPTWENRSCSCPSVIPFGKWNTNRSFLGLAGKSSSSPPWPAPGGGGLWFGVIAGPLIWLSV